MLALEIIFWASFGSLVLTHIVYPLIWILIGRMRKDNLAAADLQGDLPTVSLVIACHNEEQVIERKLNDALSLEYPPELLKLIVACDGCTDRTAELASRVAAGNDRISVLDLTRAGKVRTQDIAVRHSQGEIIAFSDANSTWEPAALRQLVSGFADQDTGYVCGKVTFVITSGDNREGLYWRYETALRESESRISSVTAGNGAIYATRKDSYIEVDPRMGHDLSFPFKMVKNGWRAAYSPEAKASERMVPSIEGEFRRKRRMMGHMWPILITGGILSPRGYSAVYAIQIFAHRLLRYLSPFLHLAMLATSIALVVKGAEDVYLVALLAQLAFIAFAVGYPLSGGRIRIFSIPYYYLLVTMAIAIGLWDWASTGTEAHWEKEAGTR